MTTKIKFVDADHVSLPVPAGTKSGESVRVGALNGVTMTDRAKTDVRPTNDDGTVNPSYNAGGGNPDGCATVHLKGAPVFIVTFAKNAGDEVYIDASNDLQAEATGNKLYGVALNTKGATEGPLIVRIAN